MGSEMCIRDRPQHLQLIGVERTQAILASGASGTSGATRALALAPVSYTHLTLPTSDLV